MRRALFLAAVSAAVPAMASPFYFNDPTQPNVLREYNLVTRTNAVGSGTVSGVGNNIGRIAANDGTGWNDESSETWQSGDSVTHEWMFVRPHRIGSYNMSVGGGGTPHGTFTVEYFDGANWQPWDSFTGNTWTFTARDPADVVAYGIRYTATDVPPGDRLRLNEFQVRLAGTHPVHIKSGFNWFVDSGRIASTASSTNVPANNWVALNGGNPDTLRDHIYLGAGGGDELKSQLGFNNADADDRAFVRYSFSDPAPIPFAVLGGSNGLGALRDLHRQRRPSGHHGREQRHGLPHRRRLDSPARPRRRHRRQHCPVPVRLPATGHLGPPADCLERPTRRHAGTGTLRRPRARPAPPGRPRPAVPRPATKRHVRNRRMRSSRACRTAIVRPAEIATYVFSQIVCLPRV
jgi:hypothetical protein